MANLQISAVFNALLWASSNDRMVPELELREIGAQASTTNEDASFCSNNSLYLVELPKLESDPWPFSFSNQPHSFGCRPHPTTGCFPSKTPRSRGSSVDDRRRRRRLLLLEQLAVSRRVPQAGQRTMAISPFKSAFLTLPWAYFVQRSGAELKTPRRWCQNSDDWQS
jgi:hypothetical protein